MTKARTLADITIPSGTPVGTTDTQTLTNKTLTSPIITGVSTFSAGTAALPALTTTGDTNTGIFFPAADTIAFTEGGVEAMRIDSSGNVGIGTTSPNTYADGTVNLTVLSSGSGTRANIILAGTSTTANEILGRLTFTNTNTTSDPYRLCAIDVKRGTDNNSGYFDFVTQNAGSGGIRARITQSGNLLVGTTTENASGGVIQVSNGITFPATQSASSDANTLDDYEEGTWTPVVSSSSGTLTSYTSSGGYTKIGRSVTVSFIAEIVTTGTASGTMRIDSFPFTDGNSMQIAALAREQSTGIAYQAFKRNGDTAGHIRTLTETGIVWTAGQIYQFGLTYFV